MGRSSRMYRRPRPVTQVRDGGRRQNNWRFLKVPRQILFIFSLLLLSALTACAGFDKGAGRAASNASDALGVLWGKGNSRATTSSSRPSRVERKSKTQGKQSSAQGAVAPAPTPADEEFEEDEPSLGGMERPGAR